MYCHSLFPPPIRTCLHSIPICENFLPRMLLANGFSPLLSHQLQYCWYNTLRLGLSTLFLCQDAIWSIMKRIGLGSWSRMVSIFILVVGIFPGLQFDKSRLRRYDMTTPSASGWSKISPSRSKYGILPLQHAETSKQTIREFPISILRGAS